MEIFEFKFKVRKMYCYWGWYVVIFNDWVRVKYSKIKINHMVNTKPHRGTDTTHCSYRNEKLSSLIATSLQVTYYYVLFSVFSPWPMAGVVLRENINMGCGQENIHFSVQIITIFRMWCLDFVWIYHCWSVKFLQFSPLSIVQVTRKRSDLS